MDETSANLEAHYRLQFNNALALIANTVYAIKGDQVPYRDKLKGAVAIQKYLPDLIRALMYFENRSKYE